MQTKIYFIEFAYFCAQAGWRKWAGEHPDMYSRRPEAVVPDWYTRRVRDVQAADTKRRLWTWEQTQKPTEKRTYGLSIEVRPSYIVLSQSFNTHKHTQVRPAQFYFVIPSENRFVLANF